MVWSFLSGGYVDVLSLKDAMQVNMLLQFFPRFFRVFPLISELKKIAGVFAESTLAGAAYYLFWYMFCSHVSVYSRTEKYYLVPFKYFQQTCTSIRVYFFKIEAYIVGGHLKKRKAYRKILLPKIKCQLIVF